MTEPPLVTLLIPARNEARDIEGCLAAVAAQDFPLDRIEVVVVDGASTDDTAALARRSLAGAGFESVHVVANPNGTTPSNLNAGLQAARGTVLCRVDARTRIQPHYVRTCVELLDARPDLSVVGGAQVALARDASSVARGIARALNNRLTMGGARYRSGAASGTADTVYLGAFRTEDLRRVGGWDERFPTNQDFALNRCMARRGTVWFEASLQSAYLPRSTLADLFGQYVRFGRWKAHYWRVTKDRPQRRQMLMLVGPLAVLCGAVALVVRSPRSIGPLAILVPAGMLLIDEVGSTAPAAPLVRLWAAAATCGVSACWWVGVGVGALVPVARRSSRG